MASPAPAAAEVPAMTSPPEHDPVGEAADFSEPWRLRNGTPVLIRAIRPDDRERIIVAFHKLDPQSVYTRFFSHRRELSDADLDRLDGTDFVNSVVLAVAHGEGDDEELIGGVSYYVRRARDGARVAEIAFTIEEDYQGQGLASKLMAVATRLARAQGLARFEAEVLAGNAPMLTVFQRCGLPLKQTREDGTVHIELDLGRDTAPP